MATGHEQPMTLLDLAVLSSRGGLGASVGDDAPDSTSGITDDAGPSGIVDDAGPLEGVGAGIADDAGPSFVGDDGTDVA
jgi:hypothetical protein